MVACRLFRIIVVVCSHRETKASSFFLTTIPRIGENLTFVNECLRARGPDGTRCARLGDGVTVVACHNLLHTAGPRVFQPLMGEKASSSMALYDGEIYNFEALAAEELAGEVRPRSGSDVILPLYNKFGATFPRWLDGEFALAVVDLSGDRIVLASDTFSTRPLWYSLHNGLRVASYRSTVEKLGSPSHTIKRVESNTVLVIALSAPHEAKDLSILERHAIHEFENRQHKTEISDFIQAFNLAVAKRTLLSTSLAIGLSSGYASGAIQLALQRQQITHTSYTIFSKEDIATFERRIDWMEPFGFLEANLILLGEADRLREGQFLRNSCDSGKNDIIDDPASHGWSYIFRQAKRSGNVVYLSGIGADELMSTYAHRKQGFFSVAAPNSNVPADPAGSEPWRSLLQAGLDDRVVKEEFLAGIHGVEIRYPFLDRAVVQEYLWLTQSTKSLRYKAPLHAFFDRTGYPFQSGERIPFSPDQNTRAGATIILKRPLGTKEWRALPESEELVSLEELSAENRFPADGVADDEADLPLQQQEDKEERLIREAIEMDRVYKTLSDTSRAGNHQVELLRAREIAFARELEFYENLRLQKMQTSLFLMLPRLAAMRGAAAGSPTLQDTAGLASAVSAEKLQQTTALARWHSVEVVTCVSADADAIVADFPVYEIFRGTTPLRVHNVCEGMRWEGVHFRLRMYTRFFQELVREPGGNSGVLYYVSDGLDVFFNEISGAEDAAVQAQATIRIIVQRYENITGSVGHSRRLIVASTERLCGWGGATLCSDAEEQRYPQAPTDSKYLNAGGYIGPADALANMISAVLEAKSEASGAEREKALESDQYFFKRFFWDNPDKVVLDYNQHIFGNFLEVSKRLCESGWTPQCAFKPCCTESDNFYRMPDLFYGHYEVRGCAVWRGGMLPISWHGNGAGKWLYLLSLDGLSRKCAIVANLTLERYDTQLVKDLFKQLEERALGEGAAWPGGFVMSEPDDGNKSVSEELLAQCVQPSSS